MSWPARVGMAGQDIHIRRGKRMFVPRRYDRSAGPRPNATYHVKHLDGQEGMRGMSRSVKPYADTFSPANGIRRARSARIRARMTGRLATAATACAALA